MTVDCAAHVFDGGNQDERIGLTKSHAGFYSKLYRGGDDTVAGIAQRLTMHGINLQGYQDFSAYKRELGRKSSFFLRHAKQACNKGYRVEFFNERNHSPDMVAIHRSKKIRSFGLMTDAFSVSVDRFGGLPSDFLRPVVPACHCHWDLMLGVFIPNYDYKQGSLVTDKQLVAYARLHRTGNMLAYRGFIGHGKFVRDGVMKLLHVHIMKWVLDAINDGGDPRVIGVQNIAHGTIERGNQGLFFWKKKALFAPYQVYLVEPTLPENFSAEEYLKINPDVAASGWDPGEHYLQYGQQEGRAYRFDNP